MAGGASGCGGQAIGRGRRVLRAGQEPGSGGQGTGHAPSSTQATVETPGSTEGDGTLAQRTLDEIGGRALAVPVGLAAGRGRTQRTGDLLQLSLAQGQATPDPT